MTSRGSPKSPAAHSKKKLCQDATGRLYRAVAAGHLAAAQRAIIDGAELRIRQSTRPGKSLNILDLALTKSPEKSLELVKLLLSSGAPRHISKGSVAILMSPDSSSVLECLLKQGWVPCGPSVNALCVTLERGFVDFTSLFRKIEKIAPLQLPLVFVSALIGGSDEKQLETFGDVRLTELFRKRVAAALSASLYRWSLENPVVSHRSRTHKVEPSRLFDMAQGASVLAAALRATDGAASPGVQWLCSRLDAKTLEEAVAGPVLKKKRLRL
jgi:hypothetical protein